MIYLHLRCAGDGKLGATQFFVSDKVGQVTVSGKLPGWVRYFARSETRPSFLIRELCGLGPVRRAREAEASRPHFPYCQLACRAAETASDRRSLYRNSIFATARPLGLEALSILTGQIEFSVNTI